MLWLKVIDSHDCLLLPYWNLPKNSACYFNLSGKRHNFCEQHTVRCHWPSNNDQNLLTTVKVHANNCIATVTQKTIQIQFAVEFTIISLSWMLREFWTLWYIMWFQLYWFRTLWHIPYQRAEKNLCYHHLTNRTMLLPHKI